jgi:predicted nucleic acid-binding protein
VRPVLDASIVLAWAFEDERTAATDAVLKLVEQDGATVPNLWRLELLNGLLSAAKRGRVTAQYCDAFLSQLGAYDITDDPDTGRYAWSGTKRLAIRFGLTPYDASYLELAQREGLPLATLDRALRTAAAALSIDLLGL